MIKNNNEKLEKTKTDDEQKIKRFSKTQLIQSEKYRDERDLLLALLDDKRYYSKDEVDKIINDFMKGKVV